MLAFTEEITVCGLPLVLHCRFTPAAERDLTGLGIECGWAPALVTIQAAYMRLDKMGVEMPAEPVLDLDKLLRADGYEIGALENALLPRAVERWEASTED